jgi:hypothetical protein
MSSAGNVEFDPGTSAAATTVPPELGLLARIAVVGVVIAGGLVAALATPSGLGLVWFIPFAGIGALLAIRRPRTSIGWILLALAWLSATVFIPVERDQFADVTVSWPLRLFAFIHGAAGPLALLLLALLAVVFPSGRLPTGRWGTVVRVALVVGLLLVLASPIAPEATSIPALVIELGAFISLAVRYRHARDIERQQLRWLAAALVFLAMAVMAGFGLYYLAPDAVESGFAAWFPAIVAVACVPIAIGIAVLRYRLYEIDTVINRALVYGGLTAIVAGIYTASIALMQRLFVTVTGEKSDAAIVLTTLVVVVGFTPLKTRLQAIVDRRFKEVRDPSTPLAEFVDALHGRMWPVKPAVALRHLLEVGIGALGATGGDVTIGAVTVAHTGADDVQPEIVVASGEATGQIVLSIGPRPAGPPYVERDRAALALAVEALARVLALEELDE